jgi:hypothetical protein
MRCGLDPNILYVGTFSYGQVITEEKQSVGPKCNDDDDLPQGKERLAFTYLPSTTFM